MQFFFKFKLYAFVSAQKFPPHSFLSAGSIKDGEALLCDHWCGGKRVRCGYRREYIRVSVEEGDQGGKLGRPNVTYIHKCNSSSRFDNAP